MINDQKLFANDRNLHSCESIITFILVRAVGFAFELVGLTAIKPWMRPGWFIANLMTMMMMIIIMMLVMMMMMVVYYSDKVDSNQTVDTTRVVHCKPDFFLTLMTLTTLMMMMVVVVIMMIRLTVIKPWI